MKIHNSRIKLNMPAIHRLDNATMKALEMTADALSGNVQDEQVVPFDTGALQRSNDLNRRDSKKGVVTLYYNTPYARYVYFHPEFHFKTINHANARGLWLEPWIDGNKSDYCQKEFAKIFKYLGGV